MDQGRTYHSEPTIDGRVYHLPPRNAGRVFSLILLLISAGLLAFGLYQSSDVLHSTGTAGRIMSLPFMVIPWLMSLVLFAVAMILLAGHNSIEVTRDQIRSKDHLGPLRWTRSRNRANIRLLDVNTMTTSTNGGPTKKIESFAMLLGMVNDDQTLPRRRQMRGALVMAWGCPRQMLLDLANELSQEIALSHGSKLMGDSAALPVTESAGSFHGDDDGTSTTERPVPQPDDAITQIEPNSIGVTLTVPPRGVWKGSKGLFFFSLLWNGFMTVFTSFFLFGALNAKNSDTTGIVIFVLFITVFWAVGIGMLLGAINAGRRRAILDVVGDTLVVTRQSIFGTKQREWRAEDLLTFE